jgi:uncharacterized protein YjiS (DUF1127 family)
MRPRSRGVECRETSWLAKLRAMLRWRHRKRRLSVDRLSDHLLRDTGLERVPAVMRHRSW